MNSPQVHAPHERTIIAVALSLVGGFLDAYSYLLKGGVFANAQTGNVVLMFLAMGGGAFRDMLRYLIPVLTFAAGILVAESFKHRACGTKDPAVFRLRVVLVIEAFLCALIGLLGPRVPHFAVNCLISFVAAMQVSAFDRLKGNQMATTMITGNLKNAMINAGFFLRTKEAKYLDSFFNYCVVILSFGLGVLLGFLCIGAFSDLSILAAIPLLCVPLIALGRGQEKKSALADAREP